MFIMGFICGQFVLMVILITLHGMGVSNDVDDI